MKKYEWVDFEYNSAQTSDIGFTQLLAKTPRFISKSDYTAAQKRHVLIHEFQDICIKNFRNALENDDKELLHWLLNETPESFGVNYHRTLSDIHYTKPVFFRTDEMLFGQIAEIQCPGSSWGELELLYQYYLSNDFNVFLPSPAIEFSRQLREYLQDEQPKVHYLTDNASIPIGVKYFIKRTRPHILYWGIDRDIKASDCNFVRTHSFFGLCGENYFRERLEQNPPKFKYDFPPHVLFDQKATLVLPFWKKTRDFFSDEIRKIFIYSTPISSKMITLEDGREISINDFSNLTQANRRYYVKYAGTDVSENWGSKAVFRLSNESQQKCLERLKNCVSDYSKGKIWILQKEVSEKHNVCYLERCGEEKNENLNAKYSFFYGSSGLIGGVSSYRKHYKVHGQPDSVIDLILPSDCQ